MQSVITADQLELSIRMAAASSRTVVPLNIAALDPDCSAPAFFCIHSITGTGVSEYFEFANELGASARFFGIQAPKKLMMRAGEPGLLDIVARHHALSIMETQPEGRIVVGGWSAGAMVALETARHLRLLGRDVGFVVSLDGVPKNRRLTGSRLAYLAKVVRNFPNALRNDKFDRVWRQFRMKLRTLTSKIWRLDVLAQDHHPIEEVLEKFSKYPPHHQTFIMNLYDAIENHEFFPYDGKIVVYKARNEPLLLTGVEDFWRRVSPDCKIVTVPGNHEEIIKAPQVSKLVDNLRLHLI